MKCWIHMNIELCPTSMCAWLCLWCHRGPQGSTNLLGSIKVSVMIQLLNTGVEGMLRIADISSGPASYLCFKTLCCEMIIFLKKSDIFGYLWPSYNRGLSLSSESIFIIKLISRYEGSINNSFAPSEDFAAVESGRGWEECVHWAHCGAGIAGGMVWGLQCTSLGEQELRLSKASSNTANLCYYFNLWIL